MTPFDPQQLREKALERVRRGTLAQAPAGEVQGLIHELEIHQVELELQNEELRRAQAEVVDARDCYLELYEGAPVGYLTLDADGVILSANLAASRLCGRERARLVGERIERVVAPEQRDACYLHLRAVSAQLRSTCELPLECADGSTTWVRLDTVADTDRDQRLEYRVTLADVSEQRRAHEAELANQRELTDLADKLSYRTEQLRRLAVQLCTVEDRERQQLAAILHDDLQQLLLAAKFQVELLARKPEPEPSRIAQISALIIDSIEKARRLSHDLSPIPLREEGLVSAVRWFAAEMKSRHGLAVEVTAEADIAPGTGPAAQFVFRAVRELLLNVVKHAGVDNASVRIHQPREGEICVEVADRGTGITATAAAPTGLGLSTMHERLQLIGGHVDVRSEPGRGTSVRVSTPAEVRVNTELGSVRAVESDGKPAENCEARHIRVVVADDHDMVRAALAALLDAQQGIEVVAMAADGEEAIATAARTRPDVVVIDLGMPGMDGLEATRRLTAASPRTPVVALSVNESLAAAALEAGAAAFVPKNCTTDTLLAAVRSSASAGTRPIPGA